MQNSSFFLFNTDGYRITERAIIGSQLDTSYYKKGRKAVLLKA